MVIGGVSAGFLADHYGWRSGFLTLGLTGLAFGLLFQPLLSDGPLAATRKAAPRPNVAEALRYLARTPSYFVMLLKAALAGIAVWIFLSWLPLYFRENFGLSLAAASFMGTFMLQGMSVLGTLIGGWISDAGAVRDIRRRMLLHGHGYVACAPFLLIFLAHPGITMVIVAVGAFSLLRGIGGANEQPILCDVVPTQYRSTAVGLANSLSSAIGGAGVLIVGLLKERVGLNAMFGCLSPVFVAAAGALYLGYFLWVGRDIARAESAEGVARAG